MGAIYINLFLLQDMHEINAMQYSFSFVGDIHVGLTETLLKHHNPKPSSHEVCTNQKAVKRIGSIVDL